MLENFDIFDECKRIYNLDNENEQRNETIKLLDKIKDEEYPPILNHLLRDIGLYPYMQEQNSIFDDKFLLNCFKVNIGEDKPKVLHIKQSWILKKLLNGEDLIVSAPTSFGKSFIIDALIANKKPNNIVIIVPTISLMDETRRRLTKKFGKEYNIITTSGSEVKDKNIFVFPQERAIEYIDKFKDNLDLFIVDEFYKISIDSDERANLLRGVIEKIRKFAKQKYYLCPNIKNIQIKNLFGVNKEPIIIDFNTVYLNEKSIQVKNKEDKLDKLKSILFNIAKNHEPQTLIYAKSPKEVDELCRYLIQNIEKYDNKKLVEYNNWLNTYYSKNWHLCKSILCTIAIHNGVLHRPISQMNVKLFNNNIINTMICTSSLIEGVNTSAKNLILYSNRVGNNKLTSFTYKNIIGRTGRMFKYFIGNVYLLEDKPISDKSEILDFEPNKDDIIRVDEIAQIEPVKHENIRTQIFNAIKIEYKKEAKEKTDLIIKAMKNFNIQSNIDKVVSIIDKIFQINDINSLHYLNQFEISSNGDNIFKKLRTNEPFCDLEKIKILYKDNYNSSIQELCNKLKFDNLNDFFKFEKTIMYDLAKYFSDVNELQKIIYSEQNIDIKPFIKKLSNLFMPSKILQLEEYGLPRMITKKLIDKLPNIEKEEISIMTLLEEFKELGPNNIINYLKENNKFCEFDDEFIKYFFEGIS